MRCVERTFEYFDGLTLVALLRANELDAHLFDENFVRQNWFHVFVYGGFRIMVPDHELERASQLRDAWHGGQLSLSAEDCDEPRCPDCGSPTARSDPAPRRRVFAAILLAGIFLEVQISLAVGSSGLSFASLTVFWLGAFMPNLLRHFGIGRYRCSTCNHAWKSHPDQPFSVQQRQADAALDPAS